MPGGREHGRRRGVAAIAFGQRAAAIDGNVARVVARLFAIETPLPAANAEIKARAEAIVPGARPGSMAEIDGQAAELFPPRD